MMNDGLDELLNQDDDAYSETASRTVELANRMAEDNPEVDAWAIADGLVTGAVHYWLYTHQPCDDPTCDDCKRTAEERLQQLHELIDHAARESEYFHSIHDQNVGHA